MKRKKVITIVISSILALSVAGVGIFYATGKFGASNSDSAMSYQVQKLETGDLQKSITGDGTLSAKNNVSETSPLDLTIKTVEVEAGQSVNVGDTLAKVDPSALNDTIIAIKSEIDTIDSTLAQAAEIQESTATVKSQVDGRVKQILVKKGDDVKNAATSSGGLLILSTDGLMKIEAKLDTAFSIQPGDEVTIRTNGKKYKGLVGSVSADGTNCTITLTDNGPKLGADAEVFSGNASIGKGTLEINQPYIVTADGGIVNKVYVKENQKISSRTSLFYLKSVPVTETYQAQLQSRTEKVKLLAEAMELQKTGTLLSTQEGIVEAVSIKGGQVVTKDTELLTLLTGGTVSLKVAIDELDIGYVKLGQKATVAIDAVSGKKFDATVESISQVGSTSNGVTTYTVTLTLGGDASLRIGMNATATIVIEEKTGILLLPLDALQSMRGEQFVWLYTGELPTDGKGIESPGTRTVVTTGLSNDQYVEVVSGLTEQDQVVIIRANTTSANGNMNFSGLGGNMGGEMRVRPSGAAGAPSRQE